MRETEGNVDDVSIGTTILLDKQVRASLEDEKEHLQVRQQHHARKIGKEGEQSGMRRRYDTHMTGLELAMARTVVTVQPELWLALEPSQRRMIRGCTNSNRKQALV